MNWLTRTVDRLDQIKPAWLLLPNAIIALFILLAHGGALLLVRAGKASEWVADQPYLYLSVTVAAAALLSALLAWVWQPSRPIILKLHAVLLIGVAVYTLQFALSMLMNGIPGGKFSWDAGFFALLLAYPVYVARRILLPASALHIPIIQYGHVLVIAVSIVVSAGIFLRMEVWSPSASDFRDDGSSPDAGLSIPRAQEEPAVPELSGDGVISGGWLRFLVRHSNWHRVTIAPRRFLLSRTEHYRGGVIRERTAGKWRLTLFLRATLET